MCLTSICVYCYCIFLLFKYAISSVFVNLYRLAGAGSLSKCCIMPTTCGFPNCKFRSRYRGSDDNRHFYRVPKKPAVLREKWLEAIGRTEQTIVNQVRL